MAKKAISDPEIEPPQTDPGLVISPHNREAEEAVIGGILRTPKRFLEAAAILKPTDFFIRRNGLVWQAFENLTDRSDPIDRLTIEQELQKMGKFEEVGGREYLFSVEDNCPLGLNTPHYARLVKFEAWKRGIIAIANELAVQGFSRDKSQEDITNYLLEASKQALGSPTGRYLVRSGIDALAPRPEIKYLVEGLIYEKSITIIYGDGGTKKTWSSMYLAACVASGCPWGDFETHKTKVLFIDEENGESEMATRAAFCIRGALADQNLDLRYISLAAFHLDNPQDEALLTNEILAQEAGLVIFDALADLMLGDENSKQDAQPVFNALRRITEKTGAAIVVIHHANKQNGYRGSSVIKDAPDIFIKIESDEDSHFINFKTEKKRKGKSVKWSMYATWTEDRFSLSHSEKQEKTLSTVEEFIIEYLNDHGEDEKIEIQNATVAAGIGTLKAAENSIYALEAIGKIIRTNPTPSKKVRARYSVPPKEEEEQKIQPLPEKPEFLIPISSPLRGGRKRNKK
jgi:archaellum biogenesis ATPase FlaH